MTTLPDRPNTALLVIDVQNGVVEGNYRRDEEAPGRRGGTIPTAKVEFE